MAQTTVTMPKYFQRKQAMAALFKQSFKVPTKETAVEWASTIYMELSPENLTCDGECSRAAANARAKELYQALAYVNKLAGYSITEDEAYEYLNTHPIERLKINTAER